MVKNGMLVMRIDHQAVKHNGHLAILLWSLWIMYGIQSIPTETVSAVLEQIYKIF